MKSSNQNQYGCMRNTSTKKDSLKQTGNSLNLSLRRREGYHFFYVANATRWRRILNEFYLYPRQGIITNEQFKFMVCYMCDFTFMTRLSNTTLSHKSLNWSIFGKTTGFEVYILHYVVRSKVSRQLTFFLINKYNIYRNLVYMNDLCHIHLFIQFVFSTIN